MQKKIFLLIILTLILSLGALAKTRTLPSPAISNDTDALLAQFSKRDDSALFLSSLRKRTLSMGPRAVPALVKVMKEDTYTDKKRWLATFAIGKIMGKKSLPFISKFTHHPNWILRLAGLKTLLALKDPSSKEFYRKALKDPSLIVRLQALENIRELGIKEYAQDVWKMIFHKHNYKGKKGQRKRTVIISKAIRALGDLEYRPAKKSLIKLIQSKKYGDIVRDIDYSLSKMTKKKSPSQVQEKIAFWGRFKDGPE
ncbi:MAG: HEAT repeat domain-containing protein [Bacteriovoracales bacterium]|nr:HEAT repeat domain-containing protein [Bacteriovoracales bacterium]